MVGMGLGDGSEHSGPALGVATVTGQGRTASAVAAELMDALADEPRVVECDLAGTVAEGSAVTEAFRPVASYLAQWPGPMVMMHVPDASLRADLSPVADTAERLFMHASWDATAEDHHVLPHLQRHQQRLPPHPGTAREARAFVAAILTDWRMARLIGPANQVVTELVNSAETNDAAPVQLTLSRVDQRIRIAVRDNGDSPVPSDHVLGDPPLTGVGAQLVRAFTEHSGVIPGRSGGKTVWAVLDGTHAPVGEHTTHGATSRTGPRRTPPQQGTHRHARAGRIGRHLRSIVSMRSTNADR